MIASKRLCGGGSHVLFQIAVHADELTITNNTEPVLPVGYPILHHEQGTGRSEISPHRRRIGIHVGRSSWMKIYQDLPSAISV